MAVMPGAPMAPAGAPGMAPDPAMGGNPANYPSTSPPLVAQMLGPLLQQQQQDEAAMQQQQMQAVMMVLASMKQTSLASAAAASAPAPPTGDETDAQGTAPGPAGY